MEGITIKELIKQLQKFPEDYKVNLCIKYQADNDYGDGWTTLWTDDIDVPFEANEENKTVTIKAWE